MLDLPLGIPVPLAAVYLAVWLWVGCRVGTKFAWAFLENDRKAYPSSFRNHTSPTEFHWGGGVVFGLVLATVWPVITAGYLLRNQLFAPPKSVQAELDAKKVKQLEKELGIK